MIREGDQYKNIIENEQGTSLPAVPVDNPTLSLPINLPYQFLIENETNRYRYHLKIGQGGSGEIGRMIASKETRYTPSGVESTGESKERISSLPRMKFANEALAKHHLLNEQTNQEFFNYLGELDKKAPKEYEAFLANPGYETLAALFNKDTSIDKKIPNIAQKKQEVLTALHPEK